MSWKGCVEIGFDPATKKSQQKALLSCKEGVCMVSLTHGAERSILEASQLQNEEQVSLKAEQAAQKLAKEQEQGVRSQSFARQNLMEFTWLWLENIQSFKKLRPRGNILHYMGCHLGQYTVLLLYTP